MKKIIFLYCLTTIFFSCKDRTVYDGNYRLKNELVVKYVKEYFERNKKELLIDDYVIRIFSNTFEDTLNVSIDYTSDLCTVYNNPGLMYGYVKTIPFIYYSGAEKIVSSRTDNSSYIYFLKTVLKRQYKRYIKQKTLDPPSCGFCEVISIVILDDKIIRVTYGNNISKLLH